MKVTEINVSAGRVVSHPVESYSNLKPMVSLKAVIEEGDDYERCIKDLQAKAEELVEDHANALKQHIRDRYYLAQKERDARRLESTILESQRELERIRNDATLMLNGEKEATDDDLRKEESDW